MPPPERACTAGTAALMLSVLLLPRLWPIAAVADLLRPIDVAVFALYRAFQAPLAVDASTAGQPLGVTLQTYEVQSSNMNEQSCRLKMGTQTFHHQLMAFATDRARHLWLGSVSPEERTAAICRCQHLASVDLWLEA
jgi:predicted N-acetyltransferase YhbS